MQWLAHPEKDSTPEFRVYGSPVLIRSEGVSSPVVIEHFVGSAGAGRWVPVVNCAVPWTLHPQQPAVVITIPGFYRVTGMRGGERIRVDDYASLEDLKRVEGVIQ